MGIIEFKRFIDELKRILEKNILLVDKSINEEYSKGFIINYSKLLKILDDYSENFSNVSPENKKIAVAYSGNPEITLKYILDSMIYGNKVTLVISNIKDFNTLLIDFIIDSFKNVNLKNLWINYSPDYNEIYLRDNELIFNEILYIGGYYEYLQFKSFFRKQVKYNNYGFMKLLIDKNRYVLEYQKIIKYANSENLSIEIYTDPDDFISESREEDYSIVFCDMQTFNQIKRGIRAGTLLVNAFPYEEYKFTIDR